MQEVTTDNKITNEVTRCTILIRFVTESKKSKEAVLHAC